MTEANRQGHVEGLAISDSLECQVNLAVGST